MFSVWEWIYLGAMILGLGYLLLLIVTGELLGDADGDLDLDTDVDFDMDADIGGDIAPSHDGLHDFSFFAPKFLASLMLGFGSTGLFATWTLKLPWYLHVPLAAVGAWGAGFLLFRSLAQIVYRAQGSSEVRVHELWGTLGEVTTPIPAGRLGEIRFIAQGAYVSTAARSATGEALERGQMVIIEQVKDSVAIVRPTR